MNSPEQVRPKVVPLLNDQERYRLSGNEVVERLSSDRHSGLTAAAAAERQALYGANVLAEDPKDPFYKKLINQFKDYMIIILIIAALLSGFLGEIADAVIIIAIVIINAVLGVLQEGKAEKAIEALQKMSAPGARILRDKTQQMVKSAELVPGDIVLLEAGDIVPADIRLLESSNLKAEEASLTGESVPVDKDADAVCPADSGIGDRVNMLYSSTNISYGRGVGIVVGTAEDTEVGKIADRLKGIKQEDTPLQQSLNQLGKILGTLCLLVCLIVFVVGLFQGGKPLELFLTAVSLAVAAIPEGLPAVVTIVLALGMNRMASENAIVKRLMAVETLGSIDTICSDKTGTLTQNAMTVTRLYLDEQYYNVSGTGYAPQGEINLDETSAPATETPVLKRLMAIACLCNDSSLKQDDNGNWGILGDPTEGALLTLAAKLNYNREELKKEFEFAGDLPFDSTRKMMSVYYKGFAEGALSLTKGAPDIVLEYCDTELTSKGVVKLTDERRAAIMAANSSFATTALRVLSYAFKAHPNSDFSTAERGMTFVGLSGMIDPARPEVKDAIAICNTAGIRPIMITGDYKDTAVAIAHDLGLMKEGDGVLTGQELEKMSDETLRESCRSVSVYARVSPEHKVRIVSALRDNDHITSMTGDGVNDAPALKQADIGVAMGITGTEVAKGAADMILTDDNFATIVSAVREGRIIYSNIRKFVGFLLSCNVGEILVIFITNLLLGPAFAPLAPIQLLWLNLVTDSFPALALGQELGETHIMKHPPRRKDEKIIDKEMLLAILFQSLGIFVAVFAAFQVGRYFYLDNILNEAGEVVRQVQSFHFFALPEAGIAPHDGARTFAFLTLISAELLRAFSCRSEHQSVFKIGVFSNKVMNKSILLAFAMMLIVVFVPALDHLFHTINPTLRDWGFIIPLSFIPFIVGELFKLFYHRRDLKD